MTEDPGRAYLAARLDVVGRDRRGSELCRDLSTVTDEFFAGLFEAVAPGGDREGLALVATGGYGRAELCPGSDLDVMLLHDGRSGISAVAERLWYPVWDTGLKLGHAVRSVREALSLADNDLDTATALLSARHLAGDRALTATVAERAVGQWQRRAKRWLATLAEAVEDRHRERGEVAFLLEPDLKDGRGGLRDVHALGWAEQARRVLLDDDPATLSTAYDVLLEARVELHRRTGRSNDLLLLQEQDGVASALGDADADALMKRVATAARTIAWTSDEAWDRIRSSLRGPLGRTGRRDRAIAPGLSLRDGAVHLDAEADPRSDPVLVLAAAAAAAHARARIDRASLDRLAEHTPTFPDPWPAGARRQLASLLGAGRDAIGVLEALDQRDLLTKVLPEWEPVRSRPQRNAYHRFTVDRHLCETAANAAALARNVSRPDVLLVGAWLHDLGKGYPGDHTEVGMVLIDEIGRRMGFDDDDVRALVGMVEHHLLLPDVATRRDLDDDGTIQSVADAVGSPVVLELLDALTEADSLATGPSAWGSWKAGLVRQLVARVGHVLAGGEAAEVTGDQTIPDDLEALVAAGEQALRGDGEWLTVVSADRPGLFCRVAGVLALHGLDVLEASAWSDDRGIAVERYRVRPTHTDVPEWDRVVPEVERALAGRLSLDARLAERARTYRTPPPRAAATAEPRLLVDNEISADSTVLEVRAPDGIGVLYRITRALSELDLDIRYAKVQTLGHEVIDTFYVRDASGAKVVDVAFLGEIDAAVLHELARASG